MRLSDRHWSGLGIEVGSVLHNLGVTCGRLGDHQTALEMLKKAERQYVKHMREDPSHVYLSGLEYVNVVTQLLRDLSDAYRALGDREARKKQLEKSLEIRQGYHDTTGPDGLRRRREDPNGPDHYEVGVVLTYFAAAFDAPGEIRVKKLALQRSLFFFSMIPMANFPDDSRMKWAEKELAKLHRVVVPPLDTQLQENLKEYPFLNRQLMLEIVPF